MCSSRNPINERTAPSLAGALVIGSLLLGFPQPAAAEPAIATAESEEALELTESQLRLILSGSLTRWPDGRPVSLVLPPYASAEMNWICTELLGLPLDTYLRLLLDRVVRGELNRPVQTHSSEEVQGLLTLRDGAIAPIPSGTLQDGVQEVTIR